jgi:hypothetical protein
MVFRGYHHFISSFTIYTLLSVCMTPLWCFEFLIFILSGLHSLERLPVFIKNRPVNPSRMFSFLLNNISFLWDILYMINYYVIYTRRQCYSLQSHSMTIPSGTCSFWDFNIHLGIYYTLDFLILNMRFNFHILRFIFFKNYMNIHNPLINCTFHIHLFHWPKI